MRIIRLFTTLFVLTVFVVEAGEPRFEDGNVLLHSCKSAIATYDSNRGTSESMAETMRCAGYLSGFSDGYVAGIVEAQKRLEKRGIKVTLKDLDSLCGMQDTPVIQRARMLVKKLEERPEILHYPAAVLTGIIMGSYFHCK